MCLLEILKVPLIYIVGVVKLSVVQIRWEFNKIQVDEEHMLFVA